MLGIMLEIYSITNQMCEKPSISKLWIWNTKYFDRNSRFCRNTRVFFWINRFSLEITHMSAKTRKERVQVRTYIHMSCNSLPPYAYLYWFWMTPCSVFVCILPGCPPPPLLWKITKKTNEKYVFFKIDQETSGKESDLPISSMESTSSMMKVFTDEWKIFFFVVLFTVVSILGLFSRLLNHALN